MDVTLASEDANSKLRLRLLLLLMLMLKKCVGNSLMQIWKLKFGHKVKKISDTRSYAALRAADLDWIIGPGYSSVGYILGENHEKPTWNHEKPGITEKPGM